jgi:hypothetical protein
VKWLLKLSIAACIFFGVADPLIAQGPPGATSRFTLLADDAFLGSSEPIFDVSHQAGWLSGLSVSGLLQNTSGMWANSSALTRFGRQAGEHHGANSLSVERELIQLDLNYWLNADNQFFVRFWGVYEPPYPGRLILSLVQPSITIIVSRRSIIATMCAKPTGRQRLVN